MCALAAALQPYSTALGHRIFPVSDLIVSADDKAIGLQILFCRLQKRFVDISYVACRYNDKVKGLC